MSDAAPAGNAPAAPQPSPDGAAALRRARLALLLHRAQGALQREDHDTALAAFTEALAIEPGLDAVHAYVGAILVGLDRAADAEPYLRAALRLNPANAEALNNLGRVALTQDDAATAAAHFAAAHAASPGWSVPARNLALARERLGDTAGARTAWTAALAVAPDDVETLVGLGDLLMRSGDGEAALPLLQAAIERAPDNVAALFALGSLHLRRRDGEAATAVLERARALSPQTADIHNSLGAAHARSRRFAEAAACYVAALGCRPGDAALLTNLAGARLELGDLDAAEAAIATALAADPSLAPAHYNLGKILLRRERFEQAAAAFEAALVRDPGLLAAYGDLCVAYHDLGRIAEAEATIRTGLERAPGDAMLVYNLTHLLYEQGRFDEARPLAEGNAATHPDYAHAHVALGLLTNARGERAQALAHIKRAAALAPHDIRILGQLARLHESQWHPEEALAVYSRILALDPGDREAVVRSVDAMLSLAQWDRYDETVDRLIRAVAEAADGDAALAFNLQALAVPYGFVADAARRSTAALLRKEKPRPTAPVRRSAEPARLRVGYALPYTHWHSLPMVLKPVIEAHDRTAVEVIGYSVNPDDGTAFSRDYRAAFDRFVDLAFLRNDVAAERIRADRLDLLVDVSGHTVMSCLPVLAQRPAAIQAHMLGYSITCGANFVDYLMTDRRFMPEACAAHNSEAAVYLPDSFMIAPRLPRRARGLTRAQAGLPAGAFVIANFNHPCKFEPTIFASWMRVLRAVPDAVLWLGGWIEATQRNLRAAAAAAGIDPARLIFAPLVAREDHIERLALADIALDTLHHGGGITSIDALWAGVPLLSVAGATPAARMGVTLLTAAGAPDLICRDLAEYEARAVGFARDRAALAAVRSRFAAAVDASPLFDVTRYARHLEHAFRLMWRDHAAGRRGPIEVPALAPT